MERFKGAATNHLQTELGALNDKRFIGGEMAVKPPLAESILLSLEDTLEVMFGVKESQNALLQRLHGSSNPETDQGIKNAAAPAGAIACINDRLDRLRLIAGDLRDNQSALNAIA